MHEMGLKEFFCYSQSCIVYALLPIIVDPRSCFNGHRSQHCCILVALYEDHTRSLAKASPLERDSIEIN